MASTSPTTPPRSGPISLLPTPPPTLLSTRIETQLQLQPWHTSEINQGAMETDLAVTNEPFDFPDPPSPTLGIAQDLEDHTNDNMDVDEDVHLFNTNAEQVSTFPHPTSVQKPVANGQSRLDAESLGEGCRAEVIETGVEALFIPCESDSETVDGDDGIPTGHDGGERRFVLYRRPMDVDTRPSLPAQADKQKEVKVYAHALLDSDDSDEEDDGGIIFLGAVPSQTVTRREPAQAPVSNLEAFDIHFDLFDDIPPSSRGGRKRRREVGDEGDDEGERRSDRRHQAEEHAEDEEEWDEEEYEEEEGDEREERGDERFAMGSGTSSSPLREISPSDLRRAAQTNQAAQAERDAQAANRAHRGQVAQGGRGNGNGNGNGGRAGGRFSGNRTLPPRIQANIARMLLYGTTDPRHPRLSLLRQLQLRDAGITSWADIAHRVGAERHDFDRVRHAASAMQERIPFAIERDLL